jgi:hypothetical protein
MAEIGGSGLVSGEGILFRRRIYAIIRASVRI